MLSSLPETLPAGRLELVQKNSAIGRQLFTFVQKSCVTFLSSVTYNFRMNNFIIQAILPSRLKVIL